MTYTRKNVWELGGDWADEILWYARGVKRMKAYAAGGHSDDLKDPRGWRFFGAMHGFNAPLWTQLGYLVASDPKPSAADQATYWKQCQHGSWYFLPWHRGYLIAFEARVRAEIKALGGPADTWALPYWNYFKANENGLPPAFASKSWPDGASDNPLFVPQRYGPDNNGQVYVDLSQVNLDALNFHHFIGSSGGGSPGFGGRKTGFNHSAGAHGGLESQPHDMVHVLVGGGTQQKPGLMSIPDTAGLDPIFWLHHANIDRLWEVWKTVPASQGDPTVAAWAKGPPNSGGRAFVMPMPPAAGAPPTPPTVAWTYTPGQMSDLAKLGYVYDDTTPPAQAQPLAARLQTLSAPAPATAKLVEETAAMTSSADAEPPPAELLGANAGETPLVGPGASAAVALAPAVRRKVTASLAAAATAAARPDRVFLNLENVRGDNDATTFDVYVGVPPGEDPTRHPDHKAGSIGLFGVSSASRADGEHAGDGLSFVLEISRIVDSLHLQGRLDAGDLHVRLVPRRPVNADDHIRIGRISVYRQPG